jgi:hypothetical protein
MKGESAAEELARDASAVAVLGVTSSELVTVGSADEPVRVIRLVKGPAAAGRRPPGAIPAAARSARRRRLPRPAAEKE